jgi:plastocyanin
MRKIFTLLAISFSSLCLYATQYTVGVSGLSYSPATIQANVGDTINFNISGHPTRQVSESTWDANGTTQLTGGFNSSSNFQYVITENAHIYYVCTSHIGSGMKGKIEVSITNGIERNNAISIQQPVLFPNPSTKGILKLSNTETVKLVVNDAIGNIVFSDMVTKNWDCNLNSGLYFYYTIVGNKRSKTQKLIIY